MCEKEKTHGMKVPQSLNQLQKIVYTLINCINLKTAGKYSVHKCLWNKETLTLLITFSVHICAFQGNVVLTDFEYTILSLLRTRTDTEDVRFAVREKYPIHSARQREPMMNQERYSTIRLTAKF